MSKAKPARMDVDTEGGETKGAALAGGSSAPARTAALSAPPADRGPPTSSATTNPKASDVTMTPEEEEASWGEDYHRDPKTGKKTLTRIPTTIAFPPSVLREIQGRLREDQTHNLQTLVFSALSHIGIKINPEHLTPKRRRGFR